MIFPKGYTKLEDIPDDKLARMMHDYAKKGRKSYRYPQEWYVLREEEKLREGMRAAQREAEIEKHRAEKWAHAEKAEHYEMNTHMLERVNGKLPYSDEK